MRGLVLKILALAWSYLVISLALHTYTSSNPSPDASKSYSLSDSKVLGPHCDEVDSTDRCLLYNASLLELIARPELFEGRRVRVTGYVHLEFEGNALYLGRHDLQHRQYANGLWVEFLTGMANKECQDKFVVIEGTFVSGDRGHLGMWSGAIQEITRCDPW